MSLRSAVIGGSLLAHGGLVFALGEIRAPERHVATAIEVMESTKENLPPPPAPEVEPPPLEPPRPRSNNERPTEVPAAEAPPPESSSPLANLPDFGLELSGGPGGGLAVARPPGLAPPSKPGPIKKSLEQSPSPKAVDPCQEPTAKPKLLSLRQPAYTEAARAAGAEGKVRVQLTVDETGKVVDVRALSTLGYGLDEAAIAAAKAATFEPAVRCGRPDRSTFTISIRFSAG